MKTTIQVQVTEPGLWFDADLTYAQVPGWGGHVTQDLKLSVIRHRPDPETPLPLILWICGGSWMKVDHHVHMMEFAELARHGYIVASAEYRTSNLAKFPAQLEDIKAAVRYLRANAALFHADPGRFGVMGGSAGGHLAALLGVTGETRQFDKGLYLNESSAVQAVCDWYGPSDVARLGLGPRGNWGGNAASPGAFLVGDYVDGHPELTEPANPAAYVSENTPPFLLVHGTADRTVPFAQSELLYEALQAKNVPSDLYLVEGADHSSIEFVQPQMKALYTAFFDKYLRGID